MSCRLNSLVSRGALVLVALSIAGLAVSCTPKPLIRFKAMYIDMDGTLLGPDDKIRESSLRAIERYKACGGQVGIATGRVPDQVKSYLPEVRPTLPVIYANGGLSTTPDGMTPLYLAKLSPTVIKPVIVKGRTLAGVRGVIIHEIIETIVDRDDKDFIDFIAKGHIFPTKIDPDAGETYEGVPLKIMYLMERDKIEPAFNEVKALVGDQARAVISSPFTIEILPLNISKAGPIKRALAAVGIGLKDAIFFGDSGNDVEALAEIGVGFAMGNCRSGACKAALATIGTNETDAIARVIEAVALTPDCPELD